MTKTEYAKVELELMLKGYELFSYRISRNKFCCYIRNIENKNAVKDLENPNEMKIIVGYRCKTVKRRMLDWYVKNRGVVLLQHSA